ncbi:MAG TPA: acetate kinase, partial [Desulfobacteraceae bacterium]|nr:acetate kinase [Desulfobacteraceae bacterium]
PLAGVMMGTRCGDLDPAIFGYLMTHTGLSQDELDEVLNKKSGLKGICGYNDLRDIHDKSAQGDTNAALAVDMFAYQIKKYIGAYAAVLGRVDALVFTAGVGENDEIVRWKALEGLDFLGIEIDKAVNDVRNPKPHTIHTENSRIQVWVVPTDEERQIAIETRGVLEKQ